MLNQESYQMSEVPKPVYHVHMCPGVVMSVYKDVNWFHRTMMRIALGWVFEKHEGDA